MNKFQISNFKYQIKKISKVKNWKSEKLDFNRGFTLVELLMSIGIMLVLMSVMTGVFGSTIDTTLDSSATSGVDQDGKFIIARLAYDMQRASQIVTPAAPGSTTSPTLTIAINSVNYTYSLSGSDLILTDDTGPNNLNSNSTQVSNLTFQRLGIGNMTDTVQVKFKLSS
ncbi:MAG TPA: prepilin-type N-terminal cleavage/methylation domain-containing protein, partial [Candidatus Saccharimonadales bacterium]|nr:prepilin-type N-terminal cleavage/methylation domain-containing protein [Candidatus Saccharimonadales bacterium]